MPTTEVRASGAAQRIRLSFFSAAKAAFFGNRGNIKTLISEFNYPLRPRPDVGAHDRRDRAPGCGEVTSRSRCTRSASQGRVIEVAPPALDPAPPRDLLAAAALDRRDIRRASAPAAVSSAARGLRYRDFLTIALVIDGEDLFPDDLDLHPRAGGAGGAHPELPLLESLDVPDPTKACVGLEYFCFEGDDLWTMSDSDLVELGRHELERLNLAKADKVIRGYVVRVPKAYPMYDAEYAERVEELRGLAANIQNLQQVGRNGLHRYNNSDHSMLSRHGGRSTTSSTARCTTSGRSTPRASTTRRSPWTSSPTRKPRNPGDAGARSVE